MLFSGRERSNLTPTSIELILAAQKLGVDAFDLTRAEIRSIVCCHIEAVYNAESVYAQCTRCKQVYFSALEIPVICPSLLPEKVKTDKDRRAEVLKKIFRSGRVFLHNAWDLAKEDTEENHQIDALKYAVSQIESDNYKPAILAANVPVSLFGRCKKGDAVENWPKSRPLRCLLINGHEGECVFTIPPKEL